jgi:hypothetical protein
VRRAAIVLAVLGGCDGADPGEGADQLVRVPGAQRVAAPLPQAAAGPAITFVDQRVTRSFPGEAGVPLGGRAEGAARTVLVGHPDDDAHWIVPVGLPDPVVAGELDFALRFDLSRDVSTGPLELVLAAVDGAGQVGPHRAVPFEVAADEPDGELVITLHWDRDADLDLYVVDPAGVEIGPKNLNSYEPPRPGEPPDPPDAWMTGGILDVDSNAGCVIDGRRRESAIWRAPPPPGRYRVSVDVASTCGHPVAAFTITARRAGALIGSAAGLVYPDDARDNRASGGTALFALELDVP